MEQLLYSLLCLAIVSQIVAKAFCCTDWYSYRVDNRKCHTREYRQHIKVKQNGYCSRFIYSCMYKRYMWHSYSAND